VSVQFADLRRSERERAGCADAVEKVGFEVVAVAEGGNWENTDYWSVASDC
jgi:hypothetical protein